MMSKVDLILFPISLFEGLMRRPLGFEWKFSLWSFRVMDASDFANDSMRSFSPRFEAIDSASLFIWLYKWSLAFFVYLCHFFVKEFYVMFR